MTPAFGCPKIDINLDVNNDLGNEIKSFYFNQQNDAFVVEDKTGKKSTVYFDSAKGWVKDNNTVCAIDKECDVFLKDKNNALVGEIHLSSKGLAIPEADEFEPAKLIFTPYKSRLVKNSVNKFPKPKKGTPITVEYSFSSAMIANGIDKGKGKGEIMGVSFDSLDFWASHIADPYEMFCNDENNKTSTPNRSETLRNYYECYKSQAKASNKYFPVAAIHSVKVNSGDKPKATFNYINGYSENTFTARSSSFLNKRLMAKVIPGERVLLAGCKIVPVTPPTVVDDASAEGVISPAQ